jgi:hypothetical protein
MSEVSTLQRDDQDLVERLAIKKEKLSGIVTAIKERD